MHNIFTNLPPCPTHGEAFETLLSHHHITVERIVSASFNHGRWMEQEQDEWVLLLQGEATLNVAGDVMALQCGDYLFLKARTPHRVINTSAQALWLAMHITSCKHLPA